MKVVRCPWCFTPCEVDDRRLDGGDKAMEHVRRCPYVHNGKAASHG